MYMTSLLDVLHQGMLNHWLSASILTALIITIFLRKRQISKFSYPPGPRGLPLLKNIFDIPTSHEYLTYEKWGKRYGDVVYISALGKELIILNSLKAANDLLDQKSALYSDRPYLPMVHDPNLANLNYAFALKRYSKSWKLERQMFTRHINPTSVAQVFSAKQLSATHRLLHSMLSNPLNLKDYLALTTGRIILGLAYGYDIERFDDPIVTMVEDAMRIAGEAILPKYLVNILPILKHIPAWVPGNKFKEIARVAAQKQNQMVQTTFDWAIQRLASGDYSPSFVQTAMKEESDEQVKLHIKDVAGTMYATGVDTTTAGFHHLILQLILHPELQYRAQKELDAIIGSPDSVAYRLPTFEDRKMVPYIDALIKESLRFMPPLCAGVPHAAIDDDEYRGWRIPRGAIVIFNAWAINRDETIYPEPTVFNPERFLRTGSQEPNPDPVAAFGFGRRVCPGRYLAETSLWLELASLLSAFTFTSGKDENGKEIDISYALNPKPGVITHCQSFPYVATPRSERVKEIIREIELQRE